MTENEQILTAVLDCNRTDLYARPVELSDDQKTLVEQMSDRRVSGEPLQYILGNSNFMGLDFKVDSRVLIPRPETEILVERAIEQLEKINRNRAISVLDIGTGSGCIAVALAKFIPESFITALDVSKDALDVAKLNAAENCVDDQITFVESPIDSYLSREAMRMESFDMIISNPPYIPTIELDNLPEDVKCEPKIALDGGRDGMLYYRQIINNGVELLKPEGCMLLEIWDNQHVQIEDICWMNKDVGDVVFFEDYLGVKRITLIRK